MLFFDNFINYFFIQPLKTLYFHGPRFLGCWSGLTHEQICSELTSHKINNGFWLQNHIECNQLIDTHFNSNLKTISTILYLILIFRFFHTLILFIEHKIFYSKNDKQIIFLKN